MDLVVSDHHGGLVKAVQQQFQGATWQRCQTHLSANIADATPKALQEEVHARLRPIFDAPDEATARTLLASFVQDYQTKAPAAVAPLERGFDDATAVLALPTPYRKRLRTTNGVEQDEAWTTGKRYFDMTAYWLWRERPAQQARFGQEAPMLQLA